MEFLPVLRMSNLIFKRRRKAFELLLESLDPKTQAQRYLRNGHDGRNNRRLADDFSRAELSHPGHAELHWLLVAMIQDAAGDPDKACPLETWTPTRNLV